MVRPRADTHYAPVQGLSRGLSLLHALNRFPGGWATIADLSGATGLHRTTVRRLLETLQAEGYVRRSASDDSYRLNQKVRQLSDGFTDDEWISEVANPVLGELLQQLVWPSDLCTLDGDAMLVRETTHRFSPLSFHRGMIRQRLPLLLTAAGRAYLAFCSPGEREALLHMLAAGQDEQSALARQRVLVDRMLDKVRTQGYASNDGEWKLQTKVSALAVPVVYRGKLLATINVVFMKKAMLVPAAAERFLPALQGAVETIVQQLEARDLPAESLVSGDAQLAKSRLGGLQ